MERISDHVQIDTVINEDFVKKTRYAVEILASEEGWIHSPCYVE